MNELGEHSAAQADVALLVDWENLKFSLAQRERRPNVTALRSAAERFGRIVYARAYADWQDPVHAGDPAGLYMAGLEPVYVLTKRYTEASGEIRIKNSVDIKLAADCIEASHQYPNVQTYIIVTGDHGFLHVVNTLRPHGKRVVVIGVSWTTATQLTEQADVVLYYDIDVEPPMESAQPVFSSEKSAPKKFAPALAEAADSAIRILESQGTGTGLGQRNIAETLDLVLSVTREYRNEHREFSVSLLGQELQKRMPSADFLRFGKGRARVFVQALQQQNLLKLVSRDFIDWIFLPDETEDLEPPAAPPSFERPRFDYGELVWSDLDEQVQVSCIRALMEERERPGVDFLVFNKIRDLLMPIVKRDGFAAKNVVNSMIAVGVLRLDDTKHSRDPATGAPFSYNTIAVELQHPDVRRALKLG